MPVFKNEDNGTWYVMARYADWKGERKQKCKRGFATKREAQEWERRFQLQNAADLDMDFEAIVELYTNDIKNRLKENTWLTKEHIIRTKILPYFGRLKISEITTKEIIAWQNELLALTAADFDFEKETVAINKSYQRLHGEDVITTPKTKKSNRTIKMPRFLCEEMQEYIGMLYGVKKKDRIFTVTKHYLHHEMDRGARPAGVKRIRIHDLRHSHISLLIDMGFSAVAIADRVGHESIEITYRYTHLFPSKQKEMADRLDDLGKGDF